MLTPTPTTPAEHTALRLRLLEQGYTPLAAKGKLCLIKNWPRIDVTPEVIEEWEYRSQLVTTGLRVDDDLLVLDFDIDDSAMLRRIESRVEVEDPALFDLLLQMPKRLGGGVKYALICRRKTGKFEQYWSKTYYRPDDMEDCPHDPPRQRLEVFSGGGSKGRCMALYGAHTVKNGDIVRSYHWEDGWGLADTPRHTLPALTLKQVTYLVDVVSDEMYKAKWVYEVSAIHGSVKTTTSYTLLPEMRFATDAGDTVDLTELEEICDGPLRVSMSFTEDGAVNTSRGLVSRNASDGRVQVWDFATATMFRPAALDVHLVGASLGKALRQNPYTSLDPANESDGDARPFIPVGGGDLTEASKAIARFLARQRHLFNMGGRIVGVLDGRIIPMDLDRLAVEIGRRVCCRIEEKEGGAVRLVEVDPSTKLVRLVASLLLESRFKDLRAITDVPVLRRDGTMVSDGYCPKTQLVVRAGRGVAESVPALEDITPDVVRAALDTLWAPFVHFPFVGPLDKGGALAALLTAVLRPVLTTAPAFGMDAPTQGSGKSLLSRCVGALAGVCKLYPPLPVRDDDEVRKVLLSVLMEAPRAAVFDNMLGLLDSGALGAVLTSETFSSRILGTNTSLHAPTSVLVLMNGNNLALAGDMPRRVVVVRIDPKHEVPHTRQFDFDPEALVRSHRGEMLAAALTLVRAALPAAGRGRVGSFEMWDEMVGQTVKWVGENVDSSFGDPAESIQQAVEFDPRREELSVLLTLLRRSFGNLWFSASEVCAQMSQGNALAEAFDLDKTPSAKSVGRYLTNRKDGRAAGATLQHRKDPRTKVAQFRVWEDGDSADVVVEGVFQQKRDRIQKTVQTANLSN